MTDKKLQEAPIKAVPRKQHPELKELRMSWAGKLFFAGVAAWLGGTAYKGVKAGMKAPRMPIKIRGSKQQIRAVMDAITSSRSFQDEINKPGATIDGVINKLKIKDMNKQNFERLTGKRWPI